MRSTWPCLVLLALVPTARSVDDPTPLLAQIKAVKSEGVGNEVAGKAWRSLVDLGPKALIPTLTAFDGADATAANWLRTAVDAIAEREVAAGRSLPTDALEAHLKDTRRSPVSRRIAFEWLSRIDKTTPQRLLPGLRDDPSVELRREAVAVLIQEAQGLLEKKDETAAREAFTRAFQSARDRDQVELTAKTLKKLGQEVDATAHLGFLRRWHVVGPFDSRQGKGYKAAYPPEDKIDLNAAFKGKEGASLRWKEHASTEAFAIVDFNKALGKHMGAAGYAWTVLESPAERTVEIRAASNNAIKIYLNGRQIYAREEYHHGIHDDQHQTRGTLRAGRNELLVKVCQNEQKDEWAQTWQFQLRICDTVGGAVPLTISSPR